MAPWQTRSEFEARWILLLSLFAGCLLLAACGSGSAEPATSPAASVTQPAEPSATTSPTAVPRRTPSGGSGQDGSPGLIAWYTKVQISNGTLTIADQRMEAEEVYFEVTFGGDGEEHQVSVVRWDGDPAALPVDEATGRVIAGSQLVLSTETVESGNQSLFEVEPIAPGKYVILCNLPGHYQSGERAGFEVVSPPPGATR